MKLQELCYLEMYQHIREELLHKQTAQIKIRRWWQFVSTMNANPQTIIMRLRASNHVSFTYNVKSFIYVNENKLYFTSSKDLCIVFDNYHQLKIYILQLFLRAKYVFKIQIKEPIGSMLPNGIVSLQLLE